LLCGRHRQHPGGAGRGAFTGQLQRQVTAVGAKQPNRQRDQERFLGWLPGRRRAALADQQPVFTAGGLVAAGDGEQWRASLAVPAPELLEIGSIGLSQRCQEIVGGCRLAVVAIQVEPQPPAEPSTPSSVWTMRINSAPLL